MCFSVEFPPETLPLPFREPGVVRKDELVTLVWSSQKGVRFRRCSIAKVPALVQIAYRSDANPYSLHCKADVAPMQFQNPQHEPAMGALQAMLVAKLRWP